MVLKVWVLANSSSIAEELVRNANPTESETLRWDQQTVFQQAL